ncbi:sensor histidine kinase [Sphingorhabdus sp.]|jgi:signal transduction histidine kinase|uniref:sensor histidine kinase n=1 Tax=Sphingorhabdus sp. TaxID=1902408 RepID=UPI0037CAC268
MNDAAPFSRVISGEVSSAGILLRADDALQQLHIRAGGNLGGTLACPALLSLTQMVAGLRMRLARAVRVADGQNSLELWVEAEPFNKDVKLSILGWRDIGNVAVKPKSRDIWPDQGQEPVKLRFDQTLRLVDASGPVEKIVKNTDFGSSAKIILGRLLGQDAPPAFQNVERFLPISRRSVRTLNDMCMSVSGQAERDGAGQISGYTLSLTQHGKVEVANFAQADRSSSGALFGKQLAPVLRQPLGRIIANAETMGSELLGPIRENYAAYARDIANAARHLTALVDDLGDLEAVERPGFSTAKDDIELGDVARRAAGLLTLTAADHRMTISLPDAQTYVPATAELKRVLQIMLNLITNAIRYSPDGTEVQVDVGTEDGFAYISVSDQGPGISVDDHERIFAKFERLGRTGDGGSGLGLYISRRLARAMGGDLTVEDAKGGGAKFTLRLPQ